MMSKKNMWEIKNIADDNSSADLYIYSEIEDDGWWSESETSANAFKEKLDSMADVKNLNIYISSLGGSVKEGLAIYSMLKRFNAHKTVYIDSFACSIATVIAMAGDEVCMYAPSVMMIHNASCGCYGNSNDFRKVADDLEKINDSIKAAYLEKSGITVDYDKLTELMNAETYLTAKECVEYGLADKIVENKKSEGNPQDSMYQNRMQKIFACSMGMNIAPQRAELTDIDKDKVEKEKAEENPPAETNNFENMMKIFNDFLGGKE